MLNIVCCCTIKPVCCPLAVVSIFDRLRCLCPILLPHHSITSIIIITRVGGMLDVLGTRVGDMLVVTVTRMVGMLVVTVT